MENSLLRAIVAVELACLIVFYRCHCIYTHSQHCSFVADALLRKAFTTPSFQGYNFVSSLLVLLGLIKVRSHRPLFTRIQFTPLTSAVPLVLRAFPERGQGEACAGRPRSPAGAGARGAARLLPKGERDRVAGLHVPVRRHNTTRRFRDSQVQNTQPVSVSHCTARWLHPGGGFGFYLIFHAFDVTHTKNILK